ncbi:hypothetical protein GOBAR_AA28034 [Gossypium barbadense]|uniref:Uncharacterized protein n=1 Tax=Gossypium barbadense TaxID=3634 RepID=A0A2P5WNI0_GOSBA|nr:hypothetical protein GOBAR_AA28034 [Gossypium barbadense]
MSETRFQNTETALKNQQASIQGLETQIGQLCKLISERPQGSLPSNAEPNPREHLNAISTHDKEGFIAPEPELMQGTVVSKGKSEVSHNKMVNDEYKPRVPYPNATRKDRSNEQFGELTLRVGDETITLQASNSGITLNIEGIRSINSSNHPDHSLERHTGVPKAVAKQGKRHDRVEAGHDFPKTRDVINPHDRVTWPWVNLIGVRHARAVKLWTTIHGLGTLCHHREARRPWSHPQRDIGVWVLPRYVLQLKFDTHSLSFRKLRRRRYFRYYACDPSLQVTASTELP